MPWPHDAIRAHELRPLTAREALPAWAFDVFRVDRQPAQLWRGAEAIALHQKPLAMLCCLLAQAGQLVTKDALLATIWPETAVSEAVLHVAIREVRQALGDTARTPRFIETVHGRGYRFIAPLSPVPTPGVLRPLETPPQAPLAFGHAPTPFVGREAEGAQLAQWWRRARQGACQVGLIAGEPGIGKTALVEAFVAALVSTEDCWVGHGQCLNHYGAGEAYLPLIEALGRLGRGPAGTVLVPLLRQYAPSWLVHMPALLAPGERLSLASEVTTAQMLRELADMLAVFTATQPLLLILEDLQWSDRA